MSPSPLRPANAVGLYKNIICLALVFLGCMVKSWLIAQTEISDATDDPLTYVQQILAPFEGGLFYGPGTGIFARIFYDLGIPFRFGLEAVFIVTLVMILGALIDWPSRSFLACGLFLFALFNPNPAELFTRILSDQIWTLMVMLGTACMVLAFRDPIRMRTSWLLWAALLLGTSTITRSSFFRLWGRWES